MRVAWWWWRRHWKHLGVAATAMLAGFYAPWWVRAGFLVGVGVLVVIGAHRTHANPGVYSAQVPSIGHEEVRLPGEGPAVVPALIDGTYRHALVLPLTTGGHVQELVGLADALERGGCYPVAAKVWRLAQRYPDADLTEALRRERRCQRLTGIGAQ